jgi:transposase
MSVQTEVHRAWKRLSRQERRLLWTYASSSPDAVLRGRAKIVLQLARGNVPRSVSRAGSCSESQLYRVAKRFIQQGLLGLADRREDNGQTKADEDYAAELLTVLAGSPQDYGYRRPTWTQELLLAVLEARTGVQLSVTTLSRLLKRLRVRLGRPKPIVGCPWRKARRTRRLRALRRLVAELPKDEVILYADEVDIHLNPKIGPDWMLPGTQKTVLTPGQNHKRYLAGALNARTGRLTWVEGERKTSDLFILQLWQLVGRDYPRAKRIHLILDNYKIHKSRQTEAALARLGGRVVLHFLPPYCPDENLIERVWRDLHANVTRNHNCPTMKALMQEVYVELQERDRILQRNYAARNAA